MLLVRTFCASYGRLTSAFRLSLSLSLSLFPLSFSPSLSDSPTLYPLHVIDVHPSLEPCTCSTRTKPPTYARPPHPLSISYIYIYREREIDMYYMSLSLSLSIYIYIYIYTYSIYNTYCYRWREKCVCIYIYIYVISFSRAAHLPPTYARPPHPAPRKRWAAPTPRPPPRIYI